MLDEVQRWLLTIILTIIFILTPGPYPTEHEEPVDRYAPIPTPVPTATPTPKSKSEPKKRSMVFKPSPHYRRPNHNIKGKASWHATGKDGRFGAACYNLRKAIGPKWRGTSVIVSYQGKILGVVLNDWCGSHDKLIDLSDEAFRYFAPLSRGVIKVGVGW